LKGELLDLEEAGNLQEEIGMIRVVTRRLLEMARGCKDMGELINVLSALVLGSAIITRKFALIY
jgi:hypothetical protein